MFAELKKYIYRGPGGAARQAAALCREGVTVDTGSLGELTMDLGRFGWLPDMLPSQEAEMGDEAGREIWKSGVVGRKGMFFIDNDARELQKEHWSGHWIQEKFSL